MMHRTVIRDRYYQVTLAAGYFGSASGLFEDGKYIDTSEDADAVFEREHHDVVTTIDYQAGFPASDFLSTSVHKCLSERALEAFRSNNLNLWSGIKWVPVRVLRKSGKQIARYWWAKCHRWKYPDVFDYENSKYTVIPPESFAKPLAPGVIVYDKVSDYVLRSDLIGSLDFLFSCRAYWYGSPRFKKVVEASGLTGFHFIPVAVSTPLHLT